MPIVNDPRSPFYYVDVRVGGKRFYQSTKISNKRPLKEAQKFEREFIARKEEELAIGTPAGLAEMTFAQASERWYGEVVSKAWTNDNNQKNTLVYLAWLNSRIGKKKLREITNAVILGLRDERALETVHGKPIAPATVNRSVSGTIARVINRAQRVWGVPHLPRILWKEIWLAEPAAQPRWVREHEEAMLRTAFADRPHYDRLVRFLRATGVRVSEAVNLRWENIDGGVFSFIQKGGKPRTVPVSAEVQGIFDACRVENPTAYVFTTDYNGAVRPITYTAFSEAWQAARRDGKLPSDLRIHDLRHDFATQCIIDGVHPFELRDAMGHSKIETTLRYAHAKPTRMSEIFAARGAKLDAGRRASSLSVVA